VTFTFTLTFLISNKEHNIRRLSEQELWEVEGCVDLRRRENVTGQKQLRNEELHGLYCPQNIIRDECELDEAYKR
jgi:hypothetical protein